MQARIQSAIDEASRWMEFEGVEGVGEGKRHSKDCILVLVSVDPAELSGIIPHTFKGFPVIIEDVGIISAQQK